MVEYAASRVTHVAEKLPQRHGESRNAATGRATWTVDRFVCAVCWVYAMVQIQRLLLTCRTIEQFWRTFPGRFCVSSAKLLNIYLCIIFYLFTYLFIYSFINLHIYYLFSHPCIYSFIYIFTFVYSFIFHLFIYLFVHLYIYLFVHSLFIYLFFRSFIN
jgi:hypothetical protein